MWYLKKGANSVSSASGRYRAYSLKSTVGDAALKGLIKKQREITLIKLYLNFWADFSIDKIYSTSHRCKGHIILYSFIH